MTYFYCTSDQLHINDKAGVSHSMKHCFHKLNSYFNALKKSQQVPQCYVVGNLLL